MEAVVRTIRGTGIKTRVAALATAVLLAPLLVVTDSSAQTSPQQRRSLDVTITSTSSTVHRRVAIMDTSGFQSYELAAVTTTPASGGDFGDIRVVFYESNPDTGNPIGRVEVPYVFEVDTGLAVEGPVRGEFMEILYLSPSSNLSPLDTDVDLVNRPVETDKGRDNGGRPLDHSFLSVGANVTTGYEHAPLVTGTATLVLGAPSRKGTFRVQLGGADVEDIQVAAGQTLRIPYTLPRRSMSVRVTNTDIAAGNYSARLLVAADAA